MVSGFANLMAALVGFGVAIAAYFYCEAQESPPPKTRTVQVPAQKPPTSNQMLMRDKLSYATKALEGLSMEDYDKIAEAGNMMGKISRAASWHIIPTEQYARMSKNFQEQARDLERHAMEKNLDAASMDYVRITLTCVQCHNYMREKQAGKKD